MASTAQEVGDVAVEPVHESCLPPSSLRRMSLDLDPCLGESAPSESGETSEAASAATDDDPIIVQGEVLRVSRAMNVSMLLEVSDLMRGLRNQRQPLLMMWRRDWQTRAPVFLKGRSLVLARAMSDLGQLLLTW
ncbi:hypothetical protein AMTR_s00132p00026950 [Amborella trichopoda]|uniref:Uncharacterized protein n=1 Tax=Amborella trichopoda TaxID=13333 RepID=W1NE57_AMBTC|nr:hypothetical protein AMTR_s00132p00026950 [Amborella trichopoda]